MTKLFVIFICVTAVLFSDILAQQLSDNDTEEKVKLSGDYYWEEATGKAFDEAKGLSRELLIKKILQEYQSKLNVNNIKTIHVDGIDYLLYLRGPKYRTIAFIEKKNVTELLETLKEMHSVEVIHSDKYPDEFSINPTEKSDMISDEVKNQITDDLDELNIPLEQYVDSNQEDALSETQIKQDNTEVVVYDNSTRRELGLSTDEIRKDLATIKDVNEMSKIINQYKLKGKLVFGPKEAFGKPDKCDIIIINPKTKEVLVYLLPKDQMYINYISKEVVTDYSTTFNGMTAIWIQFFEE